MTKAVFVDGPPRFSTVTLTWPVSVNGEIYRKIVLKRLTAKEVADWRIAMLAESKGDESSEFSVPICFDEAGNRIPAAVMDAIDDDDAFEIERRILDFLPRRYRMDTGSSPPTGEATGL